MRHQPERLLEVEDLVVDYPGRGWFARPFRALDGVSLDVRHGETVGLVGESGSGKTTFGRAVLGLAPAAAGTIRFDGRDITTADRRERRRLAREIQVVFQDPYTSLNPARTMADILTEPLATHGVPRPRPAPVSAGSSTRWACPPTPDAACPGSSPAASASGSRSPGRWPWSRD